MVREKGEGGGGGRKERGGGGKEGEGRGGGKEGEGVVGKGEGRGEFWGKMSADSLQCIENIFYL